MDTLFNTKFEGEPTQHNQPGVQLKSNTYELQESNVRLKLTVVNTVGFGDQINKEDRWDLLVIKCVWNDSLVQYQVYGPVYTWSLHAFLLIK